MNAFPSFLFFDSTGSPLHKAIGARNATGFISLAEEAQSPEKQFYTIAKNFKPGMIDTAEMKGMVKVFINLDKKLAGQIGADYLRRIPAEQLSNSENIAFMNQWSLLPEITQVAQEYINKLTTKKLYASEVLKLAASITKNTKDGAFTIFYEHGNKVDKIIGKRGFAEATADNAIYNTEILPVFLITRADTINKKISNPDFESLRKLVAKSYDKRSAERTILQSQIKWYGYVASRYKTHLAEYCKYFMEQVKKDGPDSTVKKGNWVGLNNTLYDYIFKHSEDPDQLSLAVACMKIIVDKIMISKEKDWVKSVYLDTYANLLFKIGKREEAIALQTNAVELSVFPEKTGKVNSISLEALQKMKKGEPTWPVDDKVKKGF